MADKEKSSSPAATAKGTAPSNYKYFSSLPPIFQVSDPQTKDEMTRGIRARRTTLTTCTAGRTITRRLAMR